MTVAEAVALSKARTMCHTHRITSCGGLRCGDDGVGSGGDARRESFTHGIHSTTYGRSMIRTCTPRGGGA